MTEGALGALLTALGVVGAALVAAVGTGFGLLWRRISELEKTVKKIREAKDRVMWWALDVKDMYYRYRRPGTPDLPPIPDPDPEEES